MKKAITIILPTILIACLVSCKDEGKTEEKNLSVQELREQDAKNLEQKIKQLPDVTGSLTLNYRDQNVSGNSFDKSGCNLIFASTKQKVSLNVIGSGDDEGKRLVISFPHPQDGSRSLTGTYSTAGARFAANGYFETNHPGAISLQDGTLTITECEKESVKVTLEFKGKGASLGQATGDLPNFSGTLNVENLQVVRY